MAQQFISATHIEKLGHNIREIRERSLLNIISKLNNGVTFDNDLARCKELIQKLFKWFLFEPCSHEDKVLLLLRRIFESKSGKTVVDYSGKSTFQKQIAEVRSYLSPRYHPLLDELLEIIHRCETESLVPPLESELPLSYRTGCTSDNICTLKTVGTTATPFEGFIYKGSSLDQQTGVELKSDSPSSTTQISESSGKTLTDYNLPKCYFDWQPLIEADRHVLERVESSLMNPEHPSALLHSCEFFASILLHDFPAEVFLQRPKIIMEFYNLLNCGSTRITNAVLSCLIALAKALHVRLCHCNEISLRNYKLEHLALSTVIPGSPCTNSEYDEIASEIGEKFEQPAQVDALQKNQLSVIKFSFMTVNVALRYLCFKHNDTTRKKVTQGSINSCFYLLEEVLGLLRLTIISEIWEQTGSQEVMRVLKELNDMLVKYGDALEHFRLESSLCEDEQFRMIHLCLVHQCAGMLKALIPKSKTELIFPKNLKKVLSDCLLDTTLGRLYPALYNIILDYVKTFTSDLDSLKRYKDITNICRGMSATIKFIKEHRRLNFSENLKLALDALPSISFHRELDFLKVCVDVFSEHLSEVSDDPERSAVAEEIILSLLAYNMESIRQEMYKLCHKKVIATIGPTLDVPANGVVGSQVLFLLTQNIFIEIATFGITSTNVHIKNCAEDILTYILKSKMLVCETIWDRVVQALIPSLPMLACHASKNTPLGKTLINLMDPDTAKMAFLPVTATVKANVELLYFDDPYLRDEGFSRICWLLSSQENSRELLPKVNSLYDRSLSNIWRLKRVFDINKKRSTDHFYQPSSLSQVLEVLHSDQVEPAIRRSALNQMSVMLEDPLLHQIFLDSNGLETLITILKTSLTDKDYRDYPDSAIPAVSILKSLCFYNSMVRDVLSNDVDVILSILRGLFLYFTEERMKQDGTILLFLLIFKDFINGSPSQGSFSLPSLIRDKLCMPFDCGSHWKNSDHTTEDIRESIISDRWCLSSIQIHWNAELYGGFKNLTMLNTIDYSTVQCDDILQLTQYDLNIIKTSSICHCIRKYLNNIQSGTSHGSVLGSMECLELYVYLYKISQSFEGEDETFLSHPWEQSFFRFLKALPSCEDDVILLRSLIKFLFALVPFYKNAGEECWIVEALKSDDYCLMDLLSIDSTNEDSKIISQELLKLITSCVRQEHYYLDCYKLAGTTKVQSWIKITKIIVENLKLNDAEHFYNLAYLDSLLSCLVHLTAQLGWSRNSSDLISVMVCRFCELLGAFHRGKGATATVSVMGLNITRDVLLILNHLLMEMQDLKMKGMELQFFGDSDREEALFNFIDLWRSRDVVVRAAGLQLFSGLTASSIIVKDIIDVIKVDKAHLCELAFIVFNDHSEASIVRENAAQMLANFAGHTAILYSEKVPQLHHPVLKKSSTMELFGYVEEYQFYKNCDVILKRLFTLEMSDVRKRSRGLFANGSEKSWSSNGDKDENCQIPTTPGLIRGTLNFLHDLLNLDPENVSRKTYEAGLVKLIFRALCNPAMSLLNTSEFMLCCDVLEMDIMVCLVLTKLASLNSVCLGTILHTKDCFNLLLSLLNPRIFNTNLPQLLYLRNKLWTGIFNLVSTLLEYSGDKEGNLTKRNVEAMSVVTGTLSELGSQPFVEAVCEAVSSSGSNDLQNAALISLTCLFRIEIFRTFNSDTNIVLNSLSIQNLLDSVKATKTAIISDTKENRPRTACKEACKMNLIEEAYFGNISPLPKNIVLDEDPDVSFVETNGPSAAMSGVEICKILLYLYDICTFNRPHNKFAKKKTLVVNALSGLLGLSKEAKRHALTNGFLTLVIKQLKDYHIRLSLESVDSLRRIADKKRICPLLQDVNTLLGLLNNFMLMDEKVKEEAAGVNLADLMHKLWVWFLLEKVHLVDVLKMVCTYTTRCPLACHTLPLTSAVAGLGPRKSPSNVSLLNAIINIVTKQMEQISKTHDLKPLELCFNILNNCCGVLECRLQIAKSDLFQSTSRMHPSLTKRQKPWDSIEFLWLEFLQIFTSHPEGQSTVAKSAELLELILAIANGPARQNRRLGMLVLRNLSFYQPNKLRLLSSADFINLIRGKLTNGNVEERAIVVIIIWALIANNQKAKIVLKSACIDEKLQNAIKQCELSYKEGCFIDRENLDRMYHTLSMLRDNDKKR